MLVLGVGRGAIWQTFDHDAVTRSLFLSFRKKLLSGPFSGQKPHHGETTA